MSGHSKWHNIQARKGKQDARKGDVFSKYAKKISIVAKMGGGSLDTNFALRLLIEKAKKEGMPKDNIDRAIKSGTGELKGAAQVEELMYEAYGPGGVAILIKCLTDNKYRTSAEIKHLITANGGSMGGAGSVQWMFQQWGVAEVEMSVLSEKGIKKENLEMDLIEAGAEDIWEEEGVMEIKTKVENLHKLVDKLNALGIPVKDSGLRWIAKDKVPVDVAVTEKLQNLFSALEEHDDVEDYYTNAE